MMIPRLLMAFAAIVATQACDRVTVNNSAGEVGLFVDGQGTPDPINDFRLSRDESGIVTFLLFNNYFSRASAPNRNEVIGFGEARAPTHTTTNWTRGEDSFNFALEQPIPVDLTFWIVQGPVDVADFRINTGLVASDTIWEDERAGLFIGDVEINDVTGDPDITDAILNWNGNNWLDLETAIGFAPGRLNIYWINTVDGNEARGRSDFGPHIVMGFGGTGHLLTHEIGHALALIHPEDFGLGNQFGTANVMSASSNSRLYLSEGQTFRAHFDPDSAVNALFMARPGQPVEVCHPFNESPACPGLARRIWSDGSNFPPN